MAGRPQKEDSRDKQYRVRLNDVEDDMLSFCSQETGEAKSEIFRKALKAYYENTKYFKNVLKEQAEGYDADELDFENYEGYENYGIDHISLKRSISCPYCGSENNMDFEDECTTTSEERQMGPQITYSFDLKRYTCEECNKDFRVYGSIWEYPMGAYNYEEINVDTYDDEEDEDE